MNVPGLISPASDWIGQVREAQESACSQSTVLTDGEWSQFIAAAQGTLHFTLSIGLGLPRQPPEVYTTVTFTKVGGEFITPYLGLSPSLTKLLACPTKRRSTRISYVQFYFLFCDFSVSDVPHPQAEALWSPCPAGFPRKGPPESQPSMLSWVSAARSEGDGFTVEKRQTCEYLTFVSPQKTSTSLRLWKSLAVGETEPVFF